MIFRNENIVTSSWFSNLSFELEVSFTLGTVTVLWYLYTVSCINIISADMGSAEPTTSVPHTAEVTKACKFFKIVERFCRIAASSA